MGWTIDGIPVEYVARQTPPTLTRGDEVTLPLLFVDEIAADAGDVNQYSLPYSFNYQFPSESLGFAERYRDVLDYLDYRGEDVVRYGLSDRGEPWYRERLPPTAPVDSLVVPIDAPADIQEDRSLWAILVDGEDVSNPLGSSRRIDLTLFVLAERSEYADRSAVEAAFGDEITVP
jgi:hypothetical protein